MSNESTDSFAGSEIERNKQWVENFYTKVLSGGDIDQINDLVSSGYQDHEPLPGFASNRNGLKQFFSMMRIAFPDLHNEIEFMVAENDKVVSYITMTGTHQGDYMGVPGSNKKFEVKVIDIIRVVNGKMTEHWGVGDWMAMMAQLSIDPQ